MIYLWIAIVVLILFLIGRIIRWWNLPKVEAARTDRVKTRQDNRTKRQENRRTPRRRL